MPLVPLPGARARNASVSVKIQNTTYKIQISKGYKFISSRKQEKCTKANCMTTEAHFLETMKKLDFKQCAERQYQQTLVAKNLC